MRVLNHMADAEDSSPIPSKVADTNIDLVLMRLPVGSLSAALANTWKDSTPAERAGALLETWKAHGQPKLAPSEPAQNQ